MRLLPLLLAWTALCPVSAAALTPISALQTRHLLASAQFVRAHATYQLYRVRWAGSGVRLSGLLLSEAQTAAHAGQVRSIEWSLPLPDNGILGYAETRALVEAAQTTGSACLNLRLNRLPADLNRVVSEGARRESVEQSFGGWEVISIGPGDDGPGRILTVSLNLPEGQRPNCMLPT